MIIIIIIIISELFVSDCNQTISTLGHNLTSPTSATNNYQQAQHCITTLTAPPMHRVVLRFRVLDIAKSVECRSDYLTITDLNNGSESS